MNKFGIWLGACNCLSNKAQASRFIFIHIEICMYTLLHNCKIIIVIVIWWLWTPNCCFFSRHFGEIPGEQSWTERRQIGVDYWRGLWFFMPFACRTKPSQHNYGNEIHGMGMKYDRTQIFSIQLWIVAMDFSICFQFFTFRERHKSTHQIEISDWKLASFRWNLNWLWRNVNTYFYFLI